MLLRRVPGFKSAGHALVVTAYVAINASIAFTHLDSWESPGALAHRLGWVTLVNMALVIFLALKNTPLAFLTAYSYEQLNCLHHVAGYTMFVSMVIHAALYTTFFQSDGRLSDIFAERKDMAAIVAGFAIFGVVFSAAFLRRFCYELFYVTHIACWVMAIVAVGFHQPDFTNKTLVITLITALMWSLDRIIRVGRVLYHSANNEVTLYPLPDGGTRIILKKPLARAKPGKHCFLWIPAIRKFETHPFTIHKSSPVEFVIKARDGFTRDLYKHAVAHPGAVISASIDGPYGTFPDPMEFDKIVLVAGGGGATFTFGLAANILEMIKENVRKDIVFIWAVKDHKALSWFQEQLDLLRTHTHSDRVNVSLYVTQVPLSVSDHPSESESCNDASRSKSSLKGFKSGPLSSATLEPKDASRDPESGLPLTPPTQCNLEKKEEGVISKHSGASGEDVVNTSATLCYTYFEHIVKAGRPDAASLIRDAVNTTPRNQRVLVAACGPDGLMRVVRDTTAGLIAHNGPAVELHCEQFGW